MTEYVSPDDYGISSKWPPMLLMGPRVSPEQALEFIRRTDYAFISEPSTNDREFRDEFMDYVFSGKPDYTGKPEDYQTYWERSNAIRKNLGVLTGLDHFSSHHIASCYVGGHTGVISPTGEVYMSKNFGKWPSIEEIESELSILAYNFPWLEFTLIMWDNFSEEREGPIMVWTLKDGAWTRSADPATVEVMIQTPKPDVMTSLVALLSGGRNEVRWSMDEIKSMWGDKIEEAKAI